MPDSSPIYARSQSQWPSKLQSGIVLAVTTLTHPPGRFGPRPRTIGLIQLTDGSKVMGHILGSSMIGQRVRPRLQLSCVTGEGLRLYDVAYEPLAAKPALRTQPFPGYVLALTGPSGVGKSTISNLLMQVSAPYVVKVPILTTRGRKSGDDGEYRYVSKEKFQELMGKDALVATAKIPSHTDDRWYGYRRADIERIWRQGRIPVVITEMHLLQGLAHSYGRRSILSFGLLPPGKSRRAMLSHLLRRLRTRGRETEEHIADRLKNAERDLAFFDERKDLFDHFLVNEDLDVVIEMVKKNVPGLAEA
ncbi:MAG: guanylate kinase [Candidatus Peregrinibacteria bacterium Greene0416_19]|nr:MAG: guanylate kinase [Candidatus Peregrinibacteria bacterium Greene0416_19]